MGTYRIGEVAERSGFTSSALRYYEGIGLVAPTGRTAAGARIYDDGTLERLAFIARAKQLGCTLDEITDLVALWEAERCGPVQRRLHELVTGKLAESGRQIAELTVLTTQLRSAASKLDGAAVDGPCDDTCACIADGVEEVTDPPIACTLVPAAVPDRLAQWRALLDHARAREPLADGGLRVAFGDEVELADVAALVAAEQRCCAFFSFAITVDGRGTAIEVRAPDGAADVVDALFGPVPVSP